MSEKPTNKRKKKARAHGPVVPPVGVWPDCRLPLGQVVMNPKRFWKHVQEGPCPHGCVPLFFFGEVPTLLSSVFFGFAVGAAFAGLWREVVLLLLLSLFSYGTGRFARHSVAFAQYTNKVAMMQIESITGDINQVLNDIRGAMREGEPEDPIERVIRESNELHRKKSSEGEQPS